MSHHTVTALEATRSSVDVPLPPDLAPAPGLERHRWVPVDPGRIEEHLAERGLSVKTMGRGFDADPLFFLATASAGRHAADLLSRST
jgi:hypothetical protein